MKKTYRTMKQLKVLFIGFMCLFLFNFTGCGLDEFYVVEPPVAINIPLYSENTTGSVGYEGKYFIFQTNESYFTSDSFKFTGTDVYYKIYDSYSKMNSEKETIISLANSTSSSSSASDRMITSYKYQKLRAKGYDSNVLIPFTGSDKRVYIRLTDFQDNPEFESKITVDDGLLGLPIRSGSNEYSFNFNRTQTKDNQIHKPVSGDEDVTRTSSADNQFWFVAMFAVAYGQDVTFTSYYSIPEYLGNIVIDSDSEDN